MIIKEAKYYIRDWQQHQQGDRVLVRNLYDGSVIYRGQWIGGLFPHLQDDPNEEYYGIDMGQYEGEYSGSGTCCILRRRVDENTLFLGQAPVVVELDLAL